MVATVKSRPDDSDTTDAINPEIVRGVLRRVDQIGWQRSHHLPVDVLSLSLDEACHVGAALRRFLYEVNHGR